MALRSIFIILVLVHGLIHFMGFTKGFKLAEIEQLSMPINKPQGVLWFITGLLFVLAAIVYSLKVQWWWIPATAAIVFSQILIILFWKDAKFGTIANAVILLVTLAAYGNWSFKTMVQNETRSFLEPVLLKDEKIKSEHQKVLPAVINRWLKKSGCIDKPAIQTVFLEQQGEMRTSPEGKWMSFKASQWFKVEDPGFIWTVKVDAAPGLCLAGRDIYWNGEGHMFIKLFSLLPVADSKGAKTSQGSMVRYLAETIWFPSAALQEYITWEEIDSTRAKATMTWGGITASGIFTFNDAGFPVTFEAERYYSGDNDAPLHTWYIENDPDSMKEFDGIKIPTRSAVTWKLPEGDYHWLDLEITSIMYNEKAGK